MHNCCGVRDSDRPPRWWISRNRSGNLSGFPAVSAVRRRDRRVLLDFFTGTPGALDRNVVTRLRTTCSALAVIVGLVVATAGPVFAQDRHPVCETRQHDCGKPTKISSCCCADLGQFRDASVPAQPRTELTKDVAVTVILPSFVQPVARHALPSAAQISPPRLALLDLPTLFASLLI